MNFVEAALTGNYEPVGQREEADCVIGQDFGTGSVNEKSAEFVLSRWQLANLPWIIQEGTADALTDRGVEPDHVIRGNPSTATGGELDSWTVLSRAKTEFMEPNGLNRPILLTQAFLVGRLALQAQKLGMEPIVLDGLPASFDKDSEQFWTRNRALWAMRELPGSLYLKLIGRL